MPIAEAVQRTILAYLPRSDVCGDAREALHSLQLVLLSRKSSEDKWKESLESRLPGARKGMAEARNALVSAYGGQTELLQKSPSLATGDRQIAST